MDSSESAVRAAYAVDGVTDPQNPWPKRLDAWKTFSRTMHDRGRKIEARYEDERDANEMTVGLNMNDIGGKRVNMFYSNVSVIKESLFNSLPKPSVTRMHFGDWDNDVARVAATIVQRGLTYEIKNAPFFETAIKSAILDRLVPGYGSVWVSFQGAEQDQFNEAGIKVKRGHPEFLAVDIVYWKDLMWEPQRTWEASTWRGRKLEMTPEDAKKRFGEEAAALLQPVPDKTPNTTDAAMLSGKVEVLQIWDRTSGEVLHMTCDGHVLQRIPDPYLLVNFFPTPKPLMASPPTRKFQPLADYYMAQDQYLELDILYARINLIVEAIRVAGVYDASQPSIGRMLGGTENKLIPVDNWAMFAERGGVKGSIDWFPVETIAQVLAHLVSTFSFIKQELFEVTGMADIVRGSSNQYETAAAQQIKAQFASVRLNGYQRDTAVFVRDVLRIMAELMVQLYSDERLSQVCGQLPEADQQYVPMALQLLRNDFLMQCSIDIEADSLTQADWSLEQQQRQSYVQSLSSFIQSALPVAQESPALAPLFATIVKFASVGFKGSAELEGVLDQTLDMLEKSAGQPKPPSPEEVKAQTEEKKMQMEMQNDQIRFQMEQQDRQQRLAFEQEKHRQDLEFKREEHQMKMAQMQQEGALKTQQQEMKGNLAVAQTIQKAQANAVAGKIDPKDKKEE